MLFWSFASECDVARLSMFFFSTKKKKTESYSLKKCHAFWDCIVIAFVFFLAHDLLAVSLVKLPKL